MLAWSLSQWCLCFSVWLDGQTPSLPWFSASSSYFPKLSHAFSHYSTWLDTAQNLVTFCKSNGFLKISIFSRLVFLPIHCPWLTSFLFKFGYTFYKSKDSPILPATPAPSLMSVHSLYLTNLETISTTSVTMHPTTFTASQMSGQSRKSQNKRSLKIDFTEVESRTEATRGWKQKGKRQWKEDTQQMSKWHWMGPGAVA